MASSFETAFCAVRTNYGVVKGKVVEVPLKYPGEEEYAHNVCVETYLGIPYAQQPVGVRRFKRLEPMEPWEGEWDATKFRNSPIQAASGPLLGSSITSEGEDSAWLNIWKPRSSMMSATLRASRENFLEFMRSASFLNSPAPESRDISPVFSFEQQPSPKARKKSGAAIVSSPGSETEKSQLPVLVFLCGGGFQNGSSSELMYHGQTLAANQNIVVVTLNYRLGILGFLHIPGVVEPNLGIKDQQTALKWVYDNISDFGGNPENITLAGHNAGASSAFCHYLSPESRKYFHKIVALSGCFDSLWAFGRSKKALIANSTRFIKQNGGSLEKKDRILHFLQSLPNLCFRLLLDKHTVPFGPVEESCLYCKNASEINDNLNIPIFATVTKHEGDFFTWYVFQEQIYDLVISSDDVFFKAVDEFLGGFVAPAISEKVKDFYGDRDITGQGSSVFDKISELIGDTLINLSLLRFLNDVAMAFPEAPIYFGVHEFRTESSSFPGMNLDIPDFFRCTHGVDLLYIFGHSMNRCNDEKELIMMHSLQECLADFMKYGCPVEQESLWPKFTNTANLFVRITPYRLVIEKNYRNEAVEFWESL